MKTSHLVSLALSGTLATAAFLAPRVASADSCSKYTGHIVDQTSISKQSYRGKKRDVSSLTAAVLHQMGLARGNDAKRYRNVKAHFVVMPNGTIVQNHPIEYYLPASNGISALSVAIEFAGNFKSVRGQWFKGDKYGRDTPSSEQIESGRCLLFHLRATMPGFRHVLAHRQSGAQRLNDPGPEIWCGVGEWAKKYMSLDDGGPGFKVTGGHEIDPKWRSWCSL